jgi:hypothetical protein
VGWERGIFSWSQIGEDKDLKWTGSFEKVENIFGQSKLLFSQARRSIF